MGCRRAAVFFALAVALAFITFLSTGFFEQLPPTDAFDVGRNKNSRDGERRDLCFGSSLHEHLMRWLFRFGHPACCREIASYIHSTKLTSMFGYVALGDQRPLLSVKVQVHETTSGRIFHKWQTYLLLKNMRAGDLMVVEHCDIDEFLLGISDTTPAFNLVTIDGDEPSTPELRARIGALRPVNKWYTRNLMQGPHKDRIFPLPLGLDYHHMKEQGVNVFDSESRYLDIRRQVVNGSIPKKNAILVPPMGFSNPIRWVYKQYLEQSNASFVDIMTGPKIPLPMLLRKMAMYTFVLSPPGHGYDCYRTWEIITIGAIPIVHEDEQMDMRLYDGVQVWKVRSPKDVLDGFEEQLKLVRPPTLAVPDVMNLSFWASTLRS